MALADPEVKRYVVGGELHRMDAPGARPCLGSRTSTSRIQSVQILRGVSLELPDRHAWPA